MFGEKVPGWRSARDSPPARMSPMQNRARISILVEGFSCGLSRLGVSDGRWRRASSSQPEGGGWAVCKATSSYSKDGSDMIPKTGRPAQPSSQLRFELGMKPCDEVG